ncbi:MAG: Hsp70 family protein, partial [Rhodococcus sp. (in: high G+C Gram-positive bacteria)]|nr:Hsp70 family protein [Rhodococcus sp. (in: high G+C Gram-positive bacteria)]MDX5454151.1 Hsp70 family protein [Rhodococcus sp. (in: high G+C Gram-positive bacteria)]
MAAGLGVTIGSADSVAATAFDRADTYRPVVLSRASELHLPPDDAPHLGHRPAAPGALVFTDFVSRVGDPVGVLADNGASYSGADLTATAIGCLVHEASLDLPEAPAITVAHPATWAGYTVDALREALSRAGLADVTLMPEPIAAVRWLESTQGSLGDGVVVVYDLGARTLDVSVVRTGAEPVLLGRPIASEDVCGGHLDHLVTTHLLDTVRDDVPDFDPFAAPMTAALAELRTRSRAAKEQLSTDTETVVAIDLPGVRRDVRLVRDEFEELARGPLQASTALVHEALRGAGVEPSDVGRVLLTGGGGAIPLVAELLSAELGVAVVAGPHPAHTAALGAAQPRAGTAVAAPVDDDVPTTVLPVTTARPTEAISPVRPAVVPAPAPAAAAAAAPFRSRRYVLAGAAAAALVLLGAGGLAVGTLGTSDASEAGVGAATSATVPGATPASAGGPATTATTGSGTSSAVPATTPGTRAAATAATPGAPGTVAPAGSVPAGTTAPGAAPGAPAPGAVAPGTVAPGPVAPVPTPTPPPAP